MDHLSKVEAVVLNIIKKFLKELGNERAERAVSLNAMLDSDLGIGSLEKTELLHRLEKAFSIHLSTADFLNTATVKDLIKLIYQNPKLSTPTIPEFVSPLEQAKTEIKESQTLIEVLLKYVQQEANRPHIYFQEENKPEYLFTYGELYEGALAAAQGLMQKGIKKGDTVAIMLPTSLDFFYAFFGILFAGAIPVPIYPPFRANQIEEYVKREARILHNAEVRLLITFKKAFSISQILKALIPSLDNVTSIPELQIKEKNFEIALATKNQPAMIQYTSGSTGDPKGVLLTHQNLLANIRAYGEIIQFSPQDVIVSWLPLYHDMGLIGAWLGSLYHGIPLVLMSALDFLTHPEKWLWAIHYHRGSISAAPNFAYDLCVKKIDDAMIEGLDLSSWRLALNGAEAIYPNTLRSFSKKFRKYGFNPQSMLPVYGLAESSVALTFSPLGREPWIEKLSRQAVQEQQIATLATEKDHQTLEFVSSGKPLPDHHIRIVDEQQNLLSERKIGLIQFCGPSSMQGYHRNSSATQAIFHEGWWDTGDYGYMAKGELFVVGRQKDIIIKAGRNIYPAELEELTTEIPGIRKGCVAAFGIDDPKRGTEKLIIVAETKETNATQHDIIIKKINTLITQTIGIPPDDIVLVPAGKIPKTSSGKLRRSDCKKSYIKGHLFKHRFPVWLQISNLTIHASSIKLKDKLILGFRYLYTFYAAFYFCISFLILWLSSFFVKKEHLMKIIKLWAKSFFVACGIPIKTEGLNNLDHRNHFIFISNHCSYMDTLLLLTILPINTCFIGKKELSKTPFLRRFIKKLEYIMIDRSDFSKNEPDIDEIVTTLKTRSILIFPEGTFTATAGLRPFKLGAFQIAVQSKNDIIPITLQGTRRLLRSRRWILYFNPLKIIIAKKISPQGNDWKEANHLKQLSKSIIAQNCNEPILDLISANPNL